MRGGVRHALPEVSQGGGGNGNLPQAEREVLPREEVAVTW